MIRATLAFLITASAAHAQMDDMEVMQAATSLGSVLAAEEFCGLTFDQAAIADYIGKTIPAERMDFATMLQTMTMGTEFNQKSMSASAKTAHCAATTQTAKHFGFLK